ncbi:MAG: hypothetical protein JO184_07155 [Gammaproteobacteria bacterium]|nr:hypothetical protein [Gammaproteobacteria bacterium]MBV8405357.1 hypothetical protein [Gammaproteobacteria bacterium]
MTTKGFWALALAPLAVSTTAISQQQPAYQPPPAYQQPQTPGGYQQPPYVQPTQPGAYQAPPAPSYPQSQAPATYAPQTPPPSYQQTAPPNYQAPQSAPAAYQQQPSVSYQGPQSAPAYQQPPAAQPGYQQPPPGYQQPPANRTQQPTGYAPPPASGYPPAAAGYQQPPAAYPQQSAAGYAAPPAAGYPPPGGAAAGAAAGTAAGAAANQPFNYSPQQLTSYPQAPAPAQAISEEQVDAHHKHQDTRHNHNHVYPDRGTIVHNLPAGASVVNFGGQSYWFADGVWFEPHGPAYTVIEPPIGLVVTALPSFATAVVGSAGLDFYANDTYYRPRPDLGGYEVVNDPVDSSPAAAGAAGTTAAMPPPAYAPAGAAAAMMAPAVASMAAAPAPLAAPASASLGSRQMVSLTPNNGQTPEQQARDRYDCYRWGLSQSGFDPLHPKSGPPTAQSAEQEATYDRVRTACLQQRGYTVQ